MKFNPNDVDLSNCYDVDLFSLYLVLPQSTVDVLYLDVMSHHIQYKASRAPFK